MDDLQVKVELVNQKVRFSGSSELYTRQSVPMDFSPPLGDGEGFAGLELLLISFAGCVSTAVVALLRRTGKPISHYQASARGIRREQPLSLEKIALQIEVESAELTEAELAQVCRIAETISPVWLAIKNNVAVAVDYRLTAPEPR